jgi:drug/metabolite transporter (DMT)-like permease
LGERTRWRDWVLIAVALGGVALFFCGQLDFERTWGVIAGLASGFCSAWLIMLMRRERGASPEAVTQLGNLLAVLVASPWMFSAPKFGQNGLWLLLLGAVSLGVPYLLYSRAIREVKAQDATLITVIEPVSNPVWVMLAAHERPSGWSLTGGCLVLSTSLARSIQASRNSLRPSPVPAVASAVRASTNP